MPKACRCPARATPGAAGYDIASAEDGLLAPMERRLFRTGFAIAVPEGFECQIRPRSGLALRHGISLPNTPATIDSDYRGELMIMLVNLGAEPFEVTRGMRIAQMVIARVEQATFRPVDVLPGRPGAKAGSAARAVAAATQAEMTASGLDCGSPRRRNDIRRLRQLRHLRGRTPLPDQPGPFTL